MLVTAALAALAPLGGLSGQDTCRGPGVRGTVSDESGQVRLPGAAVTIVWSRAERRQATTSTDAAGSFLVCAPDDVASAVMWAEFGDYSSEHQSVQFTSDVTAELALTILLESDPAGRVVGRVFDVRTGNGVPAADIRIAEAAVAVTNSNGAFVMAGVRPGRYRVRVDHIGYRPIEAELEARSGVTVEFELGLSPAPLELEPIVVTAVRARNLEIRGFYEREQWHELLGVGTFFTADYIDRRRPLRISHLIADASGMRLACEGSGMRGCAVLGRMGCKTQFYLDGVNLRGGPIDDFILPIEVGGIEVYPGAASLPAEFGGSDAQCGAVVVWSR